MREAPLPLPAPLFACRHDLTLHKSKRQSRSTRRLRKGGELRTDTFFSLQCSALTNWTFEAPALSPINTSFSQLIGSYSGWMFVSPSAPGDNVGVSGKQSAMTGGNSLAGSGQVAYVTNRGKLYQDVFLPSGTYLFSMSAVQRMNYQTGPQTLKVSIGAQQVLLTQPSTGDLKLYESQDITIGSSGTYRLAIEGTAFGGDSTAFIDNVGLHQTQPIFAIDPNKAGHTGCQPYMAFYRDFSAPPNTLAWEVRRMSNLTQHQPPNQNVPIIDIVAYPSWYNASVNTFIVTPTLDYLVCDKGPYQVQGSRPAQTTFQWKGNEGGALILSSDSEPLAPLSSIHRNPNAVFGAKFAPAKTLFSEAGGAIDISAELRFPMFNAVPANGGQVAQLYFALTFLDTTTGLYLPFSVLAYDSRTPAELGSTCDQAGRDDGTGRPFMLGTFSNVDLNTGQPCPIKYVRILPGSTGIQAGVEWTDLRVFRARVTASGLRGAIDSVNGFRAQLQIPLLSDKPSDYRLYDTGIGHEVVWAANTAVDSSSSFRNFSLYKVSAPIFDDVPFGASGYTEIENIYDKGITTGCGGSPQAPRIFCPTGSVTRAQMALFLLRAKYGKTFSPLAGPATSPWIDVPVTDFYYSWFIKASETGSNDWIIENCGPARFCPYDLPVTRLSMAKMLLRAKYGSTFNATPKSQSDHFTDVNELSAQEIGWIDRLRVEGITLGCTATAYCPANDVTRAQMAIFLSRTFPN